MVTLVPEMALVMATITKVVTMAKVMAMVTPALEMVLVMAMVILDPITAMVSSCFPVS